jgi:small conductance mechanosensitive channel
MRELIMNLWNTHQETFITLGRRCITALVIAGAGKVILVLTGNLIKRAVTGKMRFDENLASILRLLIHYGVVIICLIIILENFGFNTTSLIALLGAAGVAVGLALKDTLGNIAAGLILLFLRVYRKGDFIEFGSYMGSVREMNLFAITLETPDGVFISAPNSSIWGTPLKNYSRNNQRRLELSITISYLDSLDTAFRTMREIIEGEKRFLQNPAPQIMVKALEDKGVTIMLRAWADTAVFWDLYWDQSRNIKEKIEAAGLHIALPQGEIRLLH